jgi:hypothetical protein
VQAAHPAPLERLQEVRSDAPLARGILDRVSERGRTGVCVAVLLLACSLVLIDGLIGNVVAYERDTSDFYYPLMAWVGQQLRQGTFPLWAPQVFGGYPIFADGEVGLAYPPVLLALFALPADRALIALRLAHLCLASVGCYALARVWGLTHAGATLAGLTFTLGSFLQAQTHHENVIRTAVWLPVQLALVERALRREGAARRRWTAAAAASLGMAGLGLHSQVLAIELLSLAGYGLFRWSVGPIRGPAPTVLARLKAVLVVFAPVVLLGLGLAAVQLGPLAELASFSPRGSGIPYGDAAAYSLTPLGVIQLLFPFFFRTQANQQWGLWTHWESYLYVGLAPLVLAVVALVCIRRREVVGWGIMGLVGVMLALGQYSPLNLHYWLWLLPGMSGLRAPGRFSLIVMLAVAMLAAHGLSWLQLRGPRPAARQVSAFACGVPIAVGALLAAAHALILAAPLQTQDLIDRVYLSKPHDVLPLTTTDAYAGLVWSTDPANPRTLGALGALLLVSVALLAWQSGRASRVARSPAWPGLLIALTLVDLTIFSWSIHPRAQLPGLADAPAAVSSLADGGDGQPFRVLASPVLAQVASDRLAPFGLQDANGYSSLESIWHTDYLRRALRTDDQLLDLWNVRYVIDPAHFGALPSYKNVQFLPGQPMLQAAAGSRLGDQTFRLDSPTSAAEVRLVLSLMDAVDLPQGAQVGQVILHGPNGQVVGQHWLEAGVDVMEWGRDRPSEQSYVRHSRVEVAGVAQEGGAPPTERLLSFAHFGVAAGASVQSVEVRAMTARGELAVYGLAVVDTNGSAHQLFGRHNAKYTPVYRDADIAIFKNEQAFPRAFVVQAARLASAGTPLDEMAHRPFDPASEVVLAYGEVPPEVLAGLPLASGSDSRAGERGTAHVDEYTPDRVRVTTSTPRDGLLVLSDNFYPGWRAFVDGREQPVVRGDMLFRTLALPAGQHAVEFRFEPRSIELGLVVSLASLVLAIGLVMAGWRAR